ncbi:MAG: amino acid-binding protein [Anaeromyxobacter sp.]|nr:amino acid-binding protein [Anaeromyxobacter sp.]MBL0278277.1 amino acid-binding protein [Anaeromyxobacter sp.]
MSVVQLSVFLENAAGRLAEVAEVLAGGAVNVRALALADMAEFGILRLVVDQPERARAALKAAGFTTTSTPVVAVGIPDSPGGLAAVLRALSARGLAVEYMYAFARRQGEEAIILFRVEDHDGAVAALAAARLRVLDAAEVHAA